MFKNMQSNYLMKWLFIVTSLGYIIGGTLNFQEINGQQQEQQQQEEDVDEEIDSDEDEDQSSPFPSCVANISLIWLSSAIGI